jgi:HAD superfamily hydrolase (TIGR01509 family)
MVEALVFDFDGLIIDTEWCEYVSIAEQYERHGLSYELDHFQQFVGSAWPTGWATELCAAIEQHMDETELVALRRARRDELLHAMDVLPGVIELLDAADAHGIGLAVASSSTRDWVDGHLARLGLRHRFAAVLTRNDVAAAKPAPDLFLAAATALAAAPARCVAFEDSFNGCVAAKAAGMRCVVAPNRITRVQDFRHADLVVASLLEVELQHLRDLVSRS